MQRDAVQEKRKGQTRREERGDRSHLGSFRSKAESGYRELFVVACLGASLCLCEVTGSSGPLFSAGRITPNNTCQTSFMPCKTFFKKDLWGGGGGAMYRRLVRRWQGVGRFR